MKSIISFFRKLINPDRIEPDKSPMFAGFPISELIPPYCKANNNGTSCTNPVYGIIIQWGVDSDIYTIPLCRIDYETELYYLRTQ